jgi:hypothetical protein
LGGRWDLAFVGFDPLDDLGAIGGAVSAVFLEHRHDEVGEAVGNPQVGGALV